jgi:hypothetical protein
MGTLPEDLYTVRLWYLAEFFLEWEYFRQNYTENQNTHVMSDNGFFLDC